MAFIAVRGEDCDFMPSRLKTDSSINDQSLGPTNAQIRVKEDNALHLDEWCLSIVRFALSSSSGDLPV